MAVGANAGNKVLKITVTNTSGNPWDTQCFINLKNVEKGKANVVKMKVKVQDIKEKVNPNIELLGCLIVDYDARTVISRTVAEHISTLLHVFKSRIRHDVTIKESNSGYATIFEYCPRGRAARDYMQFAEEAFGVERPFKWFDFAPAAYASIAEEDTKNDKGV